MKTFITMISLFTLISAQAASISPKIVSDIESKMESQKEEYNEKTAYPVGNKRVVAVITVQVEAILKKAETMLSAVVSNKDLSEKEIAEKVKDIEYFLNVSNNLIQQLPY